MATRNNDPRRLDIVKFAADGGTLEGQWPCASFKRLAASILQTADAAPMPDVTWSAHGESRLAPGRAHDTWLGVRAHADVSLVCQRCLAPMPLTIDIARSFQFAADEDAAAALDAEDEENDVLVASRAFDLHALLEDELLLALPIVPRHEVCPEPLWLEEAVDEPMANPFAALAGWKREGGAA